MTLLVALILASIAGEAPPRVNRLANATSRYLLQHASNPIDWYPWEDAAFKTAREQNKPIFLSIGYSTCHWCHVMAEQSFSDAEVAKLMNASFVAVKVDREERPDVDATYMGAASKLMDDPGWPLNVILTPDGKPFFAAGYIPTERLRTILERVGKTWKEHPEQIAATAEMVMQSLTPQPMATDTALGNETLTKAYQQLAARFDAANGGFLPAPKVPAAHQLMFLMRYWRRSGEPHALVMVETTLRMMRRGAIYDRVEYGFHRYATDAVWQEPHTEKLLCDQAILAMAYLEAYQATGKKEYARTAQQIFTYVLRHLRSPDGAFYSAQDESARDQKIIADWNGLMIAALAHGAVALDDDSYSRSAARAADFILSRLRGKDGRLLHQSGRAGYLDDYSFVVWGLLNLYEATFAPRYLEAAIELENDALRLFRDDAGRFYLTARDAEPLLIRPRETSDGAIPSGNSVQLMNLVRLSRMTTKAEYIAAVSALLRATADDVSLAPSAATHLMNGLDFFLGPSFEIVLAGDHLDELRHAVFGSFVPNKVVLRSDTAIERLAPFTEAQKPIGRKATAYVCTNYVCRLPTRDPKRVRQMLGRVLGFRPLQ
ncbi:MAG TPA: thioredoxin domain-containing protein [Thermoanaerobaculia bacterium]